MLFDLVARKVGASLQFDGLDLQAALEAAGAGEDRQLAVATAMSIGQAVYRALTDPTRLSDVAPVFEPVRPRPVAREERLDSLLAAVAPFSQTPVQGTLF